MLSQCLPKAASWLVTAQQRGLSCSLNFMYWSWETPPARPLWVAEFKYAVYRFGFGQYQGGCLCKCFFPTASSLKWNRQSRTGDKFPKWWIEPTVEDHPYWSLPENTKRIVDFAYSFSPAIDEVGHTNHSKADCKEFPRARWNPQIRTPDSWWLRGWAKEFAQLYKNDSCRLICLTSHRDLLIGTTNEFPRPLAQPQAAFTGVQSRPEPFSDWWYHSNVL